MTKTTSLKLSKKLYKAFPKWKPEGYHEYNCAQREGVGDVCLDACPAYDTDFLLGKLHDTGFVKLMTFSEVWVASWTERADEDNWAFAESTPAEALGGLALRLKEKGLLNE